MGKTYPRVVELLRGEFETNKVTKYAFCKKTGINPTSVDRYLHGLSEPTQTSLEKLAKYFGVSVAWLRGEKRDYLEWLHKHLDEECDKEELKEKMSEFGIECEFRFKFFISKYSELWNLFLSVPDEEKEEVLYMINYGMDIMRLGIKVPDATPHS